MRPTRQTVASISAAVLITALACAGCASKTAQAGVQSGANPAPADHAVKLTAPPTSASPSTSPTPTLPQTLPNLGPAMLAQIPADSTQVVEAVGAGLNSPNAAVVFYQRTAAGWQSGASWPAHDALDGWSADKHQGDLHTPIGVFTLTDAGGLLANPGSKLPYYQSSGFTIGGRGFEGEPLAGAFDYVIAIDYNRKTGVSPLDDTYPLGYEKGTGVWLHVDHGGPTHGCVSIPRPDIISLLQQLDPSRHPVIVMGDAASLSH